METWALTTKEENNLLTQADELWMGYIISFIHLFNLKFNFDKCNVIVSLNFCFYRLS